MQKVNNNSRHADALYDASLCKGHRCALALAFIVESRDMVQEQYWREIYQLKTHVAYIELLLERSEKIDRRLKMFLAIASSGSIGSWVVWSHHSWVWASIIAGSHVITAVNQYLPYQGRIKAYSALINELEELMLQAEFNWHSIAQGELSETEINEARFEIRGHKQKALKKHVSTTIPTDIKLHSEAETIANDYLATFYPAQEES
jgi:hypothetical protein